MSDGNGAGRALLGLDGFRVVAVTETVEAVIEIESVVDFVGCLGCGVRWSGRPDTGCRPRAD